MIAQAVFKNQSLNEVNKITESNWTFLTYLKFMVYDWLTFFHCPPKKWKQMKEFTESRTQATYLLDAKFLMKRIRYLQTAVSIILPQNKQTCLRLIDVPQIQKVRKERKTMELFDEYQAQKLKQKKNQKHDSVKQLADLLIQKTPNQTIFQFASPSQKFKEIKNEQDLEKWRQQVSDSEQIEDEDVKNQIQIALKQMMAKKQVDEQYNKIYNLMQDDFKGWTQLPQLHKSGQKIKKEEKDEKYKQILANYMLKYGISSQNSSRVNQSL